MTLWLVAGALVGLLNAGIRWWTVSRLGAELPDRALLTAVGGMAVRLSLAASLLTIGLRRGIVPGLLSFGGMWITRWATVLWFNAKGVDTLRTLPARRCPALRGLDSTSGSSAGTKQGDPGAPQ